MTQSPSKPGWMVRVYLTPEFDARGVSYAVPPLEFPFEGGDKGRDAAEKFASSQAHSGYYRYDAERTICYPAHRISYVAVEKVS